MSSIEALAGVALTGLTGVRGRGGPGRALAALDTNNLVRAEAAFSVAMMMFVRVGDWPLAVNSGIERTEIIKVLADTEERTSSPASPRWR